MNATKISIGICCLALRANVTLAAQSESDSESFLETSPVRAYDAAGAELPAAADSRVEDVALEGLRGVWVRCTARDGDHAAGIARVVLLDRAPVQSSLLAGSDSNLRVLRLTRDAARPCVVAPFEGRAESEELIAVSARDRSRALVVRAFGRLGSRTRLALERSSDGGLLVSAEIELATIDPSRAASESATTIGALLIVECEDVLSGIELAAAQPLPPGVERSSPLWAAASEAGAEVVLVHHGFEPAIVSVRLRDLGIDGAASIADAATGASLGLCDSLFALPLLPRSRRTVAIRPAAAGTMPSDPDLLLVLPSRPNDEAPDEGRVERLPASDPESVPRILAALAQSGVVLLDLPSGSVEPMPHSIAELLLPRILPCKASKRPESPRDEAARFTELAANVEWALGFPAQPSDAPEWLVCPEAGFLATPLQPRIVDGFPAARGFAVYMQPGLVIVTLGLQDSELDALGRTLADPASRREVLEKVVTAQQAVRLSRKPEGLFRGLERYPRWRTEDLVPGDPIVMQRWAAFLPEGAQRRLHSLPLVPGGPALTEDVLEFTGAVNFAIDLPQPFVQPLVAVVRRLPEDGCTLTCQGGPLRLVARTRADPATWLEELYLLTPDGLESQVRVGLALEAEGGTARVARVGFFAPERSEGMPLALATPIAIAPGPAAVTFGQRSDATPIAWGGEVHWNALEMATGSRIEFALPSGTKAKRFLARATAPAREAGNDGGWLIVRLDGEEKARLDLRPGRPEPLSIRLELDAAKTIAFEVEPRGSEPGSVFVLDPRLR